MIARLEAERRDAGRAAIAAQEREHRRIAQDLHDEVNQALTAVTLRLQASIERAPAGLRRELAETKRLSSQAMEELLTLARQLRPAVLDDHGLIPALTSQVRDFGEQAGVRATFSARGTPPKLTPERQLVIYRVTQESLSNIASARRRPQGRRRALVHRTHRAADQRRRMRVRVRPGGRPRGVRDAGAGAARRRQFVDLVGRGARDSGRTDDVVSDAHPRCR